MLFAPNSGYPQEGWNKLFMKGAETPVLPALLIAGASSMIYLAATAGELSQQVRKRKHCRDSREEEVF